MTSSIDTGKWLADKNRHRGGLAAALGEIWPQPALFARIGGRPVVARIIDGLYDRIHADERLRTLFFRDPATERANQKEARIRRARTGRVGPWPASSREGVVRRPAHCGP